MASKFYFHNVAVAATDTLKNSNWDTDDRAVAGQHLTLLPNSPGNVGFTYAKSTGTVNTYRLNVAYRYDIPAGLLITGTMSGIYAGCRDTGAGNQVSPALAVEIRNSGVRKARVIEYFVPKWNGWADAPTGWAFPDGFNPTPPPASLTNIPIIDDGYVTGTGDYLVVEVGTGWFAAGSAAGPNIGSTAANPDYTLASQAGTTAKNPWIQFDTTLGAPPAADDFLLTLSASAVGARPFSPSKPGLHFFNRGTGILEIWDGSIWKDMVSSLNANGGTAVGGNITFSNTASIAVVNSSGVFTWTQLYAAPSGGYSTAATAGTAGTTSIASDAVLVFPEALGTLADRTKTLTYTDGQITALGSGVVLGILAPGATNSLRIGKWGNIAMAGQTPTDQAMLTFTKTNFADDSVTPTALFATMTNGGSAGVAGLSINLTSQPGAGKTVSADLVGISLSFSALKLSTGVSTASVYGFKSNARRTIGTSATLAQYWAANSAATGVTDNIAFLDTGTIAGTNRYTVKGVAKIQTDTDFHALGASKGFITVDTQATPEYWRMRADGTGLKDATYAVDADGFAAFTRAASASGVVTFTVGDVGTAAPTS